MEGGTGSTNADFLIWNMPIYAVANGEIVRCANGFPDNPTPPDKLSGLTDNPPTIPPGGNNLWIEHVTGEIVLYAHFRQGTIPEHLCPDDPGLWVHDVDPGIPVVAGQYLGRVGNSGESTAPHLHIHSELKATQTGLPLYYHNVDSFGEWAYDPAADPGPPWNEVVDAAISSHEVVPDPGTEAGAFALPGRRANLGIVQTTTPRPAIAGRSWSATFDLTNHGPDATPGVTLVHVLPPAFEHASDTADCEKSPAGSTLTCVIGTLAGLGPAGEESGWAVDVTADIPADLVYNNGGPVTLMSNAYVEGDRLDDSALNNVSLREVRILAESDQILESVEMISSPPKMLVGETAEVTLKVRVRSVGPSSPMDLKITWDPPSQVVPASPEIAVPAMKSGEVREVPVTMTVGCSGFGEKRVRVGAMLAPVSVNDRDPDWTNNEGRVLLAYECVLPVAINIKPGGAPNAIQAGKGNVPFAILTTGAGEYGLPLAVDALTIDDASVRFGGRDLVWTGTGGAAERHKQGHIEDSYELDDETMDGDMDLLIDVRTEDTGLTVDSTEACAAGTFDWFGLPIRFFGCDEIRMVDNNPRGSLE